MGSDNLVLLPQTRRLGQRRELPSSTPAYSAYVAYRAYVYFGMPMQLRHNRKTGCYRVLHQNVGIPVIQNDQESLFCAIIDVPQCNPCGQVHPQLQLNFRVLCLHRSKT